MINVLLLEQEEEHNSALHEALNSFEDLNVTVAAGYDQAIKLNKSIFFELLFFDASCQKEKCESILSNNIETMIIAFNGESDKKDGAKLISLGIKDYLSKNIGVDLLKHRIKNYVEIIELRKNRLFNTEAVNLFEKKIYQRTLNFQLNSHSGVVEFWDYFMDKVNKGQEEHENLKNSTKVMYAFASWLFKINQNSKVSVEYSNDAMFITLQPVEALSYKTVEDVMDKHDKGVNFKKQGNKLSLKLDRIVTQSAQNALVEKTVALDDEQKRILGKTHFNKISAEEFVNDTAISFLNKIDKLNVYEESIDEALINFENEPNTSTLNRIHKQFAEYTEIIKLLVEFDHLVFALLTLSKSINAITNEQLTPKEVKKFTTLMLHLINDLSTWRENIFIKQEANDIHYLDSSLLSSCLQIETIFANNELEEEEDNFELF